MGGDRSRRREHACLPEETTMGLGEPPRPGYLPTPKLQTPSRPANGAMARLPNIRPALARLVKEDLADQGMKADEIEKRRNAHARDLLLALEDDIHPPSVTTDGARSILKRVTTDAEIDVDHPKHEYLAPHGGRRGMGEVLVRAFGYTVAARYLDNSEEMVRERYSHIEAGELGDIAADALKEVDR